MTVLETTRLRIVPFCEEHLTERYVSWLNDPIVVRFSQQRFRTHTLASCREYSESFRGTDDEFWAIVAREPSLGHVGNMTVSRDLRHGTADIAILIGERSVWGRGYAYEAWMAMCDDLFRHGARKITAGTLATNEPMLALMRRAGMSSDGVRRRQELFEGREVDLVYAALFHDEWLPRRGVAARDKTVARSDPHAQPAPADVLGDAEQALLEDERQDGAKEP